MTLWDLKPSEIAKIKDLKESSQWARLEALGLIPDEEIACLQNTAFNGPKVYKVSGQILSLSQEMASLINIELLKGAE